MHAANDCFRYAVINPTDIFNKRIESKNSDDKAIASDTANIVMIGTRAWM
jgi:hypothetical protein